MTLYDRVNAKEFEPKCEYPAVVRTPDILRKNVSDLTDEEVSSIVKVRKQWDADKATFKKMVEAYNKEDAACLSAFHDALLKEYDVIPGTMASLLYQLAWDRGHSAGYSDVISCFSDLIPIYKEHQRVVTELEELVNGEDT